MSNQLNSGDKDLFKTKSFLRDIFEFFVLQGRKLKRVQITGTKNIFKPVNILI